MVFTQGTKNTGSQKYTKFHFIKIKIAIEKVEKEYTEVGKLFIN